MGRYVFRLPDIGEGVAEAEVIAWYIQPGDTIKEDQTMVDVMTDKATVDMTSPVDGVVTAIHGAVGDMVPVGSVLIELEVEGEGNIAGEQQSSPPTELSAAEPPLPAEPFTAPSSEPRQDALPREPRAAPKALAAPERRGRGTAPGSSPLASPALRRRAYEVGIPLQFIAGTGPGGRITADDLDDHIANGGAVAAGDGRYQARDAVTEERVIGLRRKIAEKMQDAKRRIPHIAYVEEIDVTQLEALRQQLNANRREDQPKLTMLPFLMRALVRVLPDFPHINARYDDEAGVLHRCAGIHVGIATQTPGGLMVPVVTHAESRNVWELAEELSRVARAARDGTARREELSGSTITITSLGNLGGIASTPVINHPEVAIIGPNKISERPVIEGSFVTVRKMMNLSSSFDHRIVDGYDAAQFIQNLKRMIEHPALIFMD